MNNLEKFLGFCRLACVGSVALFFVCNVASAEGSKQKMLLSKYGVSNVAGQLLELYDLALPAGGSLKRANITGFDVASGTTRRRFMANEHGILLDLVVDEVSDALISGLLMSGVKVVDSYPDYRRVTVAVDNAHALLKTADVSGVRFVYPVYPPVVRAGSVTSRAVTAMRTANASATHGVDGTDTMVGVVSDSFARTSDVRDGNTTPSAGTPGTLSGSKPQDSGDLPPTVTILSDAISGADEGAGMSELIHDIAPGASIAFHDAGNSEAAMASGIDELCSLFGISVVVDDIGFLLEAFYQDDLISQAATECVNNGIPYFSAFGNSADSGFRQSFLDASPSTDNTEFPPDGADFHDWDPGSGVDPFLGVTIAPGATITAILQWNQPNDSISADNGAQIDLDLYVASSESIAAIEGGSFTEQGTTGSPRGDAFEGVFLENTSGTNVTLYLGIDHFDGRQDTIPQDSGTSVEFRLLLLGPSGGFVTEYPGDGPTTWGHPYGEGVIGVAAVPWWEAPDFDPAGQGPTSEIDPEPFTSRGGDIPVQFDTNGNFIGITRNAPILSAVDGNNTTFFGFNGATPPIDGEDDGFPNFFGTSAAAPNAAAVALLMLDLNFELTPAQVTSILVNNAIDVTGDRSGPGSDDVTGAGLIDAAAALAAVPPFVPDTDPEPFEFMDRNNVALEQLVTSDTVQITGINSPAAISVTGGEYSAECLSDGFTTADGTIENGQTVCVRHTSAPTHSTSTDTILTVGSVSDTFTSTTGAPDSTPDSFSFPAQNGVERGSTVTSDTVTITGVNQDVPVSIEGGTYSIGCGSDFTSSSGAVSNGQSLCVRHTAASDFETVTETTLTVGGVSTVFRSTTEARDIVPDVFSFTSAEDVEPGSVVTSNIVTISGINDTSPVTIINGEYSLGCESEGFTANDGEINDGETICVRHRAVVGSDASKTTTLNVGSVTSDFTSTTREVSAASASTEDDGEPIAGSGGLGNPRTGGGCALGPAPLFDPMLLLLVLVSSAYLGVHRRRFLSRL